MSTLTDEITIVNNNEVMTEQPKKHPGGRPPRGKYKLKSRTVDDEAPALEHLELAGIEAIRYLRAVTNGEETKPHWARVDAAKEILKHAIGRPSVRIDLPTGGNNFYFQLILQAQASERKEIKEPDVIDVTPQHIDKTPDDVDNNHNI